MIFGLFAEMNKTVGAEIFGNITYQGPALKGLIPN